MVARAWPCGAALLVALATLVIAASPAHAETGRLHIILAKTGLVGGAGSLFFRGRRIDVAALGTARANLSGTASHLRSAGNIVGSYHATSAEPAVVGGGRVAHLQNANGVVLELKAARHDPELPLDVDGMVVTSRGWRHQPW
jgi:hypothetical protein